MDILQDGLMVLGTYKEALIFFFVASLGYGYLAVKHAVDPNLPPSVKLPAALAAGGVLLCLITYAVSFLAYFWPGLLRPASFLVFLFAVLILIWALARGELKVPSDAWLIPAGIAIFFLLLVRLSLLKHVILPAYSDSPIHYQILTGILHPDIAGHSRLSLGNVFGTYYHFGFHGLAAWLTSLTGFDPADMISLLGQIFLVLAPLSIFFLVHAMTGNAGAAGFSALLASAGWMMPAFAVNWGKFPALGALAMMPAVLPFLVRPVVQLRKPAALIWSVLLVVGITLMHTRIILCILMAITSLLLSYRMPVDDQVGPVQSIRLALLYVFSLWPMADLIRNFYLNPIAAVIFLLLLPFAFQAHLRLCMAVFFYTFGLWLIVFVPGYINENIPLLLDRQFVEMMLYIPFSILGGAGFAGLLQKLPSRTWQSHAAILLLAVAVLSNLLYGASVHPDPCCNYFKQDDQRAFEWLAKTSPKGTLVLIAAFDDNGKIVGTDSGIWIYPLLGLGTNKLPFNTNWNSLRTIEEICSLGAQKVYVYMGGRLYSFSNSQLAQQGSFRPVFETGQVVVYEISGCH